MGRIDERGIFLFRHAKNFDFSFDPKSSLEISIKFQARELRCKGRVRAVLDRSPGLGLEFSKVSPDFRKELGDFIEILRGEGYVA